VHLVNKLDFIREFRKKPSVDNPERLLGLTRTHGRPGTNFEHFVYLLSGVLKPQFRATCAHEYAHTWLNEHARPVRTLNKDAEEGFCKLLAWKYVSLKGEPSEVKRILENDYTRGEVHALIAAEERYQFPRVIAWIADGVDSWLDGKNPDRLLVLRDDRASPTFAWAKTVATPASETLVLSGIAGTPERRFALINHRTFAKNESGKVRVGNTHVLVHCLEIRDRSVVVRVNGNRETTELFLPQRKAGQ
jgi:hypothetical protein